MRILVLATAARWGGALSVLRSLHHHAAAGDGTHDWVFLIGGDLLPAGPGITLSMVPELQLSRRRRLLLEAGFGTSAISRWEPDVVISLQNTMPRGLKARTVLYVQQSVPFQTEFNYSLLRPDQRSLAVYQHLIGALTKWSVRSCDLVVVQSQWMQEAVQRSTGVPHDRLLVAPPDLLPIDAPSPRPPFDARQFVYPTYPSPYKNNEAIYEACRILDQQGVPGVQALLTIASGPHVPGVRHVGHMPRTDFVSLLSRSTLLFPSFFETVGLPLLEAQAIGIPVLAADRPYAREALAGYPNAAFFDPLAPTDLARLMRGVIDGRMGPSPAHAPEASGGWDKIMRAIESMAPSH
jgi:glycosyltransferase involved in cell wall biosynthesis